MVGPAVGGFLLAGTGIQGAFILSVLMYCTAQWAILTIRSRIPRAAGSGAVLARIAEGLASVRTDKRLIGVLVVTVIYNIFAWPFTSMIPVIGRDRLHLGPEAWACWRPWTGSALSWVHSWWRCGRLRDGTAGPIFAVSAVT
jgi:hypothetical protein